MLKICRVHVGLWGGGGGLFCYPYISLHFEGILVLSMSLFAGIRCIFCWSLQSITKQQRSVFTGVLMHYGLLSNHPVYVVSQSQLSLSLYTLAVFLIPRSWVYSCFVAKWFVSMHTIEEIGIAINEHSFWVTGFKCVEGLQDTDNASSNLLHV